LENFIGNQETENSPNQPRRLTTTTTTTIHALNVVSKTILNMSVLSTLENMVVKRKGRRTEKERKPT